jgi:hypothetical protein
LVGKLDLPLYCGEPRFMFPELGYRVEESVYTAMTIEQGVVFRTRQDDDASKSLEGIPSSSGTPVFDGMGIRLLAGRLEVPITIRKPILLACFM